MFVFLLASLGNETLLGRNLLKQTKFIDMDDIGSTTLAAGKNTHPPLQVWGWGFRRAEELQCSSITSLNDDQVRDSGAPSVQGAVCLMISSVFLTPTCYLHLRQSLCCKIKTCSGLPFREHLDSKKLMHPPKMSILGYCTLTTDSAELDHNPQSIAKETASAG